MQPDNNVSHPQPQKLRVRLMAAGSAAAIVLLGLGAFSLLPQQNSGQDRTAPQARFIPVSAQAAPAPSTPRMIEAGAPFSFADLVERVGPAVVTVTVEETAAPDQDVSADIPDDLPEPFKKFFREFGNQLPNREVPHKSVAMGSGFIIDRAGYIVTNNHVIDHSKKITVKLSDGREFDAKLIGTDPATDIALLKVKSDKPLPTVEFADDRQVRVGDWVIAVGNPFGLSNTVTAGIVSSLGRDIGNGPYTDFIQIDAPINRGNSGGPTFDIQGKVIGMNTMIFSPSGGSVGIGFAIPASTIHQVVAQLKDHGHVNRGWLGVQIQSMTPDIAGSLGLKSPKGAIVATVVPGSPAAKGGFRPGDVVTALNGIAVEDSRDLTRRVAAIPAGTKASFTVEREGRVQTLDVTIGQRQEQVASNDVPSANASMETPTQALGMGLAPVNTETRRLYNLDDGTQGVVVTKVDPDSDAADKGIQPGDVLLSVGDRKVTTPKDVQMSLAAAQKAGRKSILLLVDGSGGQHFVALKFG